MVCCIINWVCNIIATGSAVGCGDGSARGWVGGFACRVAGGCPSAHTPWPSRIVWPSVHSTILISGLVSPVEL